MKLFFLLFFLAICWFVFIEVVFFRLKKYHNKEYKMLGEPSIFWNNSLRNNFLFAKFLFARKYQKLNDKYLENICKGMLIFLIIYLVFFVSMIVLIFKDILQ